MDSVASWCQGHKILAATAVGHSSLLHGAYYGRVNIEAYQLAPALRLIHKPRPSLLIADDVGLGKTIEAGLAILELMARGRAKRVLIVTPAGLIQQWHQELEEKFGLRFTIIENASGLAREQERLPAGVNPWDALPRVLTSVDYLKKKVIWQRALLKRWDLAVVDEGHALAESGSPKNPYRTQRTRLGYALRDHARGLLLLTATPHNGYPHSFRSLLEIVEPSQASLMGDGPRVARRVQQAMIRRMKGQIHRIEAGAKKPLFLTRRVQGLAVDLTVEERDLLKKVGSYCSKTLRQAGRDELELVSFAMQIIKKRALSSRRALGDTLSRRLEALESGPPESEDAPKKAELRDLQADLPLADATAERISNRILEHAVPREEKHRLQEIKVLKGLQKQMRKLPKEDPKIRTLVGEIQKVLKAEPDEKFIVFTEYVSTLEALKEALGEELKFVVLRGGMSGKQRLKIQDQFEGPGVQVLLATDAASEGLNLQRACRRVIHMELPWNPNRLEQRNGRVDRYGQGRVPEIRYLHYPDSPEDDILSTIVQKIEKMHEDQVSTPDILGVLTGLDRFGHRLASLDPEEAGVKEDGKNLVKEFEDRTGDFIRNMKPLLGLREEVEKELEDVRKMVAQSRPLVPDDLGLEQLAQAILGPGSVSALDVEGLFRIEVAQRFRGPEVQASYPQATFRRSLAVKTRSKDVEYLTPLHPMIQALGAEARRRLLQVYSKNPHLPARRLSARRVVSGESASVVFSFMGQIQGAQSHEILEEPVLAMRLDLAGKAIKTAQEALTWLGMEAKPGEVPPALLERIFKAVFEKLRNQAAVLAGRELEAKAENMRQQREKIASALKAELERDQEDRLKEIDEEEKLQKGIYDEDQTRLFADEDAKVYGFKARREAAKSQAAERLKELDAFVKVSVASAPRPLGALFLVPEDA